MAVDISMTRFVDFVIKSGSPKLTSVRTTKKQLAETYSPAKNYWKQLKEAILEDLEKETGFASLDAAVSTASANRKENYRNAAKGYKRFVGKKNPAYFPVAPSKWRSSGLTVRVNPEVGLSYQGNDYAIKLHFKANKPGQSTLNSILDLIGSQISVTGKTVIPAVLDVPNAKLFVPTQSQGAMMALLVGEAASFVSIYDSV